MTIDEQPDIVAEITKAAALAWKLDKKAGEPETPTEEGLALWLETTYDTEEVDLANAKLQEAVHKFVERLVLDSTPPASPWLPIKPRELFEADKVFYSKVERATTHLHMTLQAARWIPGFSQVEVQASYKATWEFHETDGGLTPDLVSWPNRMEVTEEKMRGLADVLDLIGQLNRRPQFYQWTPADSPLIHLVRAWQGRPLPVPSNTAPERILPRHGIVVEKRVDKYGQMDLFPPYGRRGPGRQLYLPFDPSDRGPSLPLHLYGLGGKADRITRGPAPIALRLFIEALLRVPYDTRNINRPVAMQITLRDVRTSLWPRSAAGMGISRLVENLINAANVLDDWDNAIPWQNPETGESGLRRVVVVTGIGSTLDDNLRLVVDLPPGASDGPLMPANLNAWGAKSAIAYRMLIGLALRWHDPGRTHLPVRGVGGTQQWIRKPDSDEKAWPALQDDELLNLAFPHLGGGTGVMRRNRLRQAIDALKLLAQEEDLRIVAGRRILPPTIENGEQENA